MHTKIKGGIGVLKVAGFFLEREIPCFSEIFCDISETDLIVECKGILKKIQVRCVTSDKGETASLSLTSTTPGTRKTACKIRRISNVDIFALFIIDLDRILFIDAIEVSGAKSYVTFRLLPTKNHQTKGIRFAADYSLPSFF